MMEDTPRATPVFAPLPVNPAGSHGVTHQALTGFTGRGVGGEGIRFQHRFSGVISQANQTPTSSPIHSQRLLPLTPSPSPQDFGLRLISESTSLIRNLGERGACFSAGDSLNSFPSPLTP